MKRGNKLVFALLVITLLISLISVLVIADDLTDSQKLEKAEQCLENKVEQKQCKDLTSEEQAFSLLAISECKDELIENSKGEDGVCWPKSGCKLKETAIALIALDDAGSDTEHIEDWLISQTKDYTNLLWFLEIHAISNEATTCDISYSGSTHSININELGKINSGAGSCLALAMDDYYLKISSTCFEKNITISCDKDFITTVLYKKPDKSTIYVSQETHESSAGGETKERIDSKCFKRGNSCDYEGSLWATLALMIANSEKDLSPYFPYLISEITDKEKLFPETFLYFMLGYDEYRFDIIQKQKSQGFWEIMGSSNSKYYDSALAMWSLREDKPQELDNAKIYFLDHQDDDGCWGNIRDTAFLLYAGWGTGAGGGADPDDCENNGFYCMTETECLDEAQGELKEAYDCWYSSDVCCSKELQLKTCAKMHGQECALNEVCDGNEVEASDTYYCCIGTCEKESEQSECVRHGGSCYSTCLSDEEPADYNCLEAGDVCCMPIAQENKCENAGGFCRVSCFSDEEPTTEDCPDSDKVCCKTKTKIIPGGKGMKTFIIILVVLIILSILGILFRKKIRTLFFKRKSGFREHPGPTSLSPGPGSPPMPPISSMPTRMFMPRTTPVRRPRKTKLEKEMQDTLKKLKTLGGKK